MSQTQIEEFEKIISTPQLKWDEFSAFYKNIKQYVLEYPDNAEDVLPVFYRSLECKEFNADIAPTAGDTFSELVKVLSGEKTLEAFYKMLAVWKSASALLAPVLEYHQDLALPLYQDIKHKSENCSYNDLHNLGHSIVWIVRGGGDKTAEVIVDDILSNKNEKEPIVSAVYSVLGNVYKKYPNIGELVWEKLKDKDLANKYSSAYYNNLAKIAVCDKVRIDDCLSLISTQIQSEHNDGTSLTKAYEALGATILPAYPEKSAEIISIIDCGLENPANTLASKKNGWRMSGDVEKLRSRVMFGHRTNKTEENPLGWKQIDNIPADEVCVLFLGGDGTLTDKAANGYLSSVEDLLIEKGLKDRVQLYGIVYDFGDYMHSGEARLTMMNDYNHRVQLRREPKEDSVNPKYINQLFDKAIKLRITKNGNRLSAEDAARNLRKLQIVTHCHGGYTYLKLEEKMLQEMNKLGYSKTECNEILSQILVVAHAPYCPLGVAKAKMISFASARDDEVNHYNNFETAVRKLETNGKLKLCYFNQKQGDLILAPDLGKEVEQHNFIGYAVSQKGLTKEGKAIVAMSGNVLAAGIKNALENGALPDTNVLLCDGDKQYLPLLQMLKKNGKEMYAEIVSEARMLKKNQKSGR